MATNTYTALATQTLGTAASSVTFSSIPQGYTDLVVVANCWATVAADVQIYFNGVNTGGLYSGTFLYGTGSSALSTRYSNQNQQFINYYASMSTTAGEPNYIVNVMNYSNATTYKTFMSRSNRASSGVDALVGMYRSTSAITSLTLVANGSSFAIGSTFTIYGIAAASVGAKATGGTIYSDANYFYHLFTSNGTFTPASSLTADVMSVGGGGGGSIGGGGGGGGGAGELDLFSSQSLSATGYAITVGAGGAAGNSGTAGNGTTSSFASLVTSLGGGRGAGYSGSPIAAGTGGSGGGGGNDSTAGGGASGSNTNVGGTGFGYPPGTGGGGGGATAAGQNANNLKGGNGGQGYAVASISNGLVSILGSMTVLASGGGGGAQLGGTSAVGGTGGTGAGNGSADGQAATAATSYGSGGGGGSAQGGSTASAGYQGVVIVRYAK